MSRSSCVANAARGVVPIRVWKLAKDILRLGIFSRMSQTRLMSQTLIL